MQIAYYKSFKAEPEFLKLNTVFKDIRSCPELKEKTLSIQHRHRAGIVDGWKSIDKSKYQNDKRSLPFICFAGNVERSGKNEQYQDTGLMNFDFDDVGAVSLEDQRKLLNSLPYCHSTGLSVSGYVTGAFWANIAVQIPASLDAFKALPDKQKRAFGYNDRLSYFDACNKLRKLYFEVIKHYFKNAKHKDYASGIDAGSKGGSAKDTRYLTFDATLFVNPDFEYFTIEQAIGYFFDTYQGTNAGAGNRNFANDIDTNNAFDFCRQYAEKAGYTLTPGHIHNYVTNFAIAANLLGIPEPETTAYINATSPKKVTTNAITYPYAKYSKSFGLWSYRLKKSSKRIIKLERGQKLSDLNLNLDNCILLAGTGTGKTFAAMTGPDKVILCCPNNVLIENVCSDYAGAVAWYASTKDQVKLSIHTANKIVTNVQNLKSLINQLGEKTKEYKLIIDEYHYISTATAKNFMHKDYHFLCSNLEKFKSHTLMSGTGVYLLHPELNKLPIIEIESDRPEKKATLYHCDNAMYKAAKIANESVKRGHLPIILFDNKSAHRAKLVSYLKYKTAFVSSDDKQDFLKSGIIPDSVKILLCTSAMKAGNNIKNRVHFDYILLGSFHHSDIEQITSRGRNALSIRVHILRVKESLKAEHTFDAAREGEKHRIIACDYCDLHNKSNRFKLYGYRSALQIRNKVKTTPVFFNAKSNEFCIDYLHVSNEVITTELYHEYNNDDYLKLKLKDYNFVFLDNAISTDKPGINAEKAAKRAAKEHTGNVKNIYDETLQKISEQAPNWTEFCRAQIKDGATGAAKLAYQRYLFLTNCYPSLKGIDVLMETGPNQQQYNRLCIQLKVFFFQYSDLYKDQQTDISIFISEVLKCFTGASLLPEEIKHNFIKALINAGFERETINKYKSANTNKILEKLRLCFDVSGKRCRINKTGFSRKYSFVPPKWTKLLIKYPRTVAQMINTKELKNQIIGTIGKQKQLF